MHLMPQERLIGFPIVALGGTSPYVHAAAQAVETDNECTTKRSITHELIQPAIEYH